MPLIGGSFRAPFCTMEEPSWLAKARGYIDLKMFDEAWKELESLPVEQGSSPEAQEMRIIIMLDREDYGNALALCEVLCDFHPENPAGFVQGAYCLHVMDRTEDAIAMLQSGPENLRDEPVYFYNLACYELALGKAQAAWTWLQQSFEMDRGFRDRALQDSDLAELHDRIEEEKAS